MLPLDRILAFAAMAQTIIATLRATSRALYVANGGGRVPVGLMEGPLILPPNKPNETSALWDLSMAFREGVKLSLDRDKYDVKYEIDSMALTNEGLLSARSTSYSVSPYKTSDANEDSEDELERLLETATSNKGGALELRKPKPVIHRMKDAFTAGSRSFFSVVPLQKSKLDNKAAAPVQRTLDRAPSSSFDTASTEEEGDEDEDETVKTMQPNPMETDFFITLTTVCLIGAQRKAVVPRVAKVTTYAPDCFAELRSLFGISEDEFRKSVLESGPFVSFQSCSKGAARTGGVFFFSRDGAYLIKSIKRDEVHALLDMLPRYYRFMKRNGRRSLLTRFCGIYEASFRDEDGDSESPHTFVVMNSVFPPEGSRIITERFDLKGSTVGREATIEERESKGRNAVLKDMDLAREVSLIRSLQQRGKYSKTHSCGIDIGSSAKAAFMAQLRRDVQFLVDCQVIDYSLLIGVAKETAEMTEADLKVWDRAQTRLQQPTKQPNNVVSALALSMEQILPFPQSRYGAGRCVVDTGPLSQILGRRTGSRAIYYFGLIDFLQPYNTKKAIEYRLKSMVYENGAFSCVPPQEYADRFLAFLDEHMV